MHDFCLLLILASLLLLLLGSMVALAESPYDKSDGNSYAKIMEILAQGKYQPSQYNACILHISKRAIRILKSKTLSAITIIGQ